MNTNLQGNIGEAKALHYFISEGYEVYLPFGTASKYDMIVCKDNNTYKVSVKTTSSKSSTLGKYSLRIGQGKLRNRVAFNKEESDLLFAYILPEDKFIIFNSKDITQQFEITI